MKEKDTLPSHPKAKTLGKVKDINAITFSINNYTPEITIVINLRRGKVHDEPVSKRNNEEKKSNDLAQQFKKDNS